MQFRLSYVRSRLPLWQRALIAFVLASLLLGAAGVMFKSRIVTSMPVTDERAEAPAGILHFVSGGIDSWKPMELALTILRSGAHDRLYETLRDFQQTGKTQAAAGDLSRFADTTKFQYPPSSLVPINALEAIGIGSIEDLNIINLIMCALGLAAVGYLAVQYAGLQGDRNNNPRGPQDYANAWIFALAVVVGLTFYPIFAALVKGNIQIWIDCFFALACVAWLGGRKDLAGVLIALSAAIKPQLGALLLWALLWREWGFAKGFLCAVVLIGALSLLQFGIHNNLSYLDVMSMLSERGESLISNESVNGIVQRLVEPDVSRFLLWSNDYAPYRPLVHAMTLVSTLVFAVMAFVPALLRRGEEPTIFDFSAAAICFTVGSPIVWPFHYGVLLPIFVIAFIAATREAEEERNRLVLALGVAWLLCATYMPFTRLLYTAPWNVAANPHFFGALLLLFVVFRLGRVWSGAREARADAQRTA